MKILYEVISDCFSCPYLFDFSNNPDEGRDLHCSKHNGENGELDYPDIDESQVKKEWRTGKFNNLIHLEIEIPDWCPLPDKRDKDNI